MKLLSLLAVVLGLLITPAFSQSVGPLDFETPGQLPANFRASLNGGFASEQTSGGNSFVSVAAPGPTSAAYIGIYDTTPLDDFDATQTFSGAFTLSFDVSAPTTTSSGASFGIFLFDAAAPSASNLLTLYNLDTSVGGAGNEQIRFWKNVDINQTGVANQYTASAFTGTNGVANGNSWITNAGSSGATISPTSPFTFYHLDFSYDPTARTLRVASAAFSATLNIPEADVINNPGFALRINDPTINDGLGVKIDNLVLVPEPGVAGLLALAGMIMGVRRRR